MDGRLHRRDRDNVHAAEVDEQHRNNIVRAGWLAAVGSIYIEPSTDQGQREGGLDNQRTPSRNTRTFGSPPFDLSGSTVATNTAYSSSSVRPEDALSSRTEMTCGRALTQSWLPVARAVPRLPLVSDHRASRWTTQGKMKAKRWPHRLD